MKNFRAYGMSYPVIDVIADNSGDSEYYNHELEVKNADRSKGPNSKEEWITRQIGKDNKAGFTEYDQEQNEIRPYPEVLYNDTHIFVNVKNYINK